MSKCPYHDGAVRNTPEGCPLQELADHTITVTEARAPRVGVIVLLVDLDDPEHFAMASRINPEFAMAMLLDCAEDIAAHVSAGSFEQ